MKETFTHRLINDKWLPRITYMLGQVNNKGEHFRKWLQQWGFEADKKANDAAERGTRIHKACEVLATTKKITVSDFSLAPDEVKAVLGFKNFIADMKVNPIAVETIVDDGRCAGKADLLAGINGKEYCIDLKTGTSIYDEHYMQVSFYATCLNAIPAILHLKTTTKKGYQFIDLSAFGREKVDVRERWYNAYKKSYELYCLRGFPLEPKIEAEMPKIINLEV